MNDESEGFAATAVEFKTICQEIVELGGSSSDERQNKKLRCSWDILEAKLAGIFGPHHGDSHLADPSLLEWYPWLFASGDTPANFKQAMLQYDNSSACGLVWTPNYVAYRCRTCGLTPCMSLCAECFLAGNHNGHDYNMFRSLAGGACDCGNISVMKENGFCSRHTLSNNATRNPPPSLICNTECILPYAFRPLIFHLRKNFERPDGCMDQCDKFFDFLDSINEMGAGMKDVISQIMVDKNIYRRLFDPSSTSDAVLAEHLERTKRNYVAAVESLSNITTDEDAEALDCPELSSTPKCERLVEELVSWLVKYKFPQSLVTFLLSLLNNDDYIFAFAETFVAHYTRIALLLAVQSGNDTVYNRVVHISVQLMSSERISLVMAKQHKLLRLMVVSLYCIIRSCSTECTLNGRERNFHLVADCLSPIMEYHNWWVLSSDLHNVLSHKEIVLLFLRDPALVDLWCNFIALFQGMNAYKRELDRHVTYENSAHYSAFTAELEICSSTLTNFIRHLNDPSLYDCVLYVLRYVVSEIQEWFESIDFVANNCWQSSSLEFTFHLPLHRLYAAFVCQGVKMGMRLLFPSETFLCQLVMHPLQIQVARAEIAANMWVRNGPSMRYQTCLYVQSQFCASLIELDLYLLQWCATKVRPDWLVLTIADRFHLIDVLSFSPVKPVKPFLRPEWEMPMLEGALRLIATMVSNTINLGMSDDDVLRLEISTLLAFGDKTHSQLVDNIPSRANPVNNQKLEQILEELAVYKPPKFEIGGAMTQGMYSPKDIVWLEYFDPLFVMLRSVQAKDYQSAFDRYVNFLQRNGMYKSKHPLWPPYVVPRQVLPAYDSLRRLLHCRSLHAMFYVILFKAVANLYPVSEQAISLVVFLLDLAVRLPGLGAAVTETVSARHTVIDLQFCGWFPGNCIFTNLCHRIDRCLHIDNMPGLSRSCQDGSKQDGVFPDLLRFYANLLNTPVTPSSNIDNQLVPSQVPRSRSADIPFIDSMETDFDIEPDYFFDKAMACLPETLRRQYLEAPHQFPALTLENAELAPPDMTVVVSPLSAVTIVDEDMDVEQESLESVSAQSGPLAIEDANTSMVLRPFGAVCTSSTTTSSSESDDRQQPSLCLDNIEEVGRLPNSSTPPYALPQPKVHVVNTSECLISLLIKLHNRLGGEGTTYRPSKINADSSTSGPRVGDGPYFIRSVLDYSYQTSEQCRQNIDLLCDQSTPAEEHKSDSGSRDQKKQAAKERQQRLLAMFTSKQKAVMDQLKQQELETEKEAASSSAYVEEKELVECVICGQSSDAKADQSIALVALAVPTNVLAKAYPAEETLPVVCDIDEQHKLRFRGSEQQFIWDLLQTKYREVSSDGLFELHPFNDRGVCVTTCGHYVHTECQIAYVHAIRTDHNRMVQGSNVLALEKGEFYCPLCRQLANCLLPCILDSAKVYKRTDGRSYDALVNDVSEKLLLFSKKRITERERDSTCAGVSLHFLQLMNSSLTDLTWPLLVNIARTNLEAQVIWQIERLPQRRSCLRLLLNILARQIRELVDYNYFRSDWAKLTGSTFNNGEDLSLVRVCGKVPAIATDPTTILIALTLSLWNGLSQDNFVAIAQAAFNLAAFQSLICVLQERSTFSFRPTENIDHIKEVLSTGSLATLASFVHSRYYSAKANSEGSSSEQTVMRKATQIATKAQSASTTARPIDRSAAVGDLESNAYHTTGRLDQSATPMTMGVEITSSNTVRQTGRSTAADATGNVESNVSEAIRRESLSSLKNLPIVARDAASTEPTNLRTLSEESSSPTTSTAASPSSDSIKDLRCTKLTTEQLKEICSIVESNCLPLLRVAAVLKQCAFDGERRSVDLTSFSGLFSYLFGRSQRCLFVESPGHSILHSWCKEVHSMQTSAGASTAKVLTRTFLWETPKLLPLPTQFAVLFQRYLTARCMRCDKVPSETLLCLVCGKVVCSRDNCCMTNSLTELETHALDCGAGTGVYLCVQRSTILVTRDKRASHWGSLYLDAYGEEDRGLKRGVPLTLSNERYAILQQQWLLHSFDSACKMWFWITQNPIAASVIAL